MERSLLIIPTFNERKNLEKLLPRLLEYPPEIEILIVDDNSPDGTGEFVAGLKQSNPRIHYLWRESKMGLGTAYTTGFGYAIKNGFDYIFEMDADFSHNPDEIPRFLEAIQNADLVIGSRYISGVNVVNWPLSRLLLSYMANIYTRWITGMPVKDATSGFKCFRKKVLESLDLTRIKSNGYSFQIEVDFKTYKKGFRIKEIPIVFVDRQVGNSKMNKKIIYEAVWMVWKLKFRSLLGRL